MLRKIEAMYSLFGHSEGKCRDCSNFIKCRYHTKTLQKCSVYGLSHSEASDWVGKWDACGMFNKPYKGNPIIRLLDRKKPEEPIKGQMSLEDFI